MDGIRSGYARSSLHSSVYVTERGTKMNITKFENIGCFAKGKVIFVRTGHFTDKNQKAHEYASFSVEVSLPGTKTILNFFVSDRQDKEVWNFVASTLEKGQTYLFDFIVRQRCQLEKEAKHYENYLDLVGVRECDLKSKLSISCHEYQEERE